MHASAATAVGGAPVVFRGRMEKAGHRFHQMECQLNSSSASPGIQWTGSARSGRCGRALQLRLPFSDDDSRGVRFELRAFVPAHSVWPYEPAGSRPLFVHWPLNDDRPGIAGAVGTAEMRDCS